MHTLDLGVSGYSIANLWYEIIMEQEHGPRSQRVERLWLRIQELYQELGVGNKLSSFRLGLYKKM
eukprot:1037308-Pyramimonas_sp.AAC.1